MAKQGSRGSGRTWEYDQGEILADGVVHGLGLLFAIGGSAALIAWQSQGAGGGTLAAHVVYCLSLLTTLGVSAAYNLWPVTPTKWALRRVDHAMIFGLIAGTYTPLLVRANRVETTTLLVVIWVVAAAGMAIKALDLGGREWVSTVLYVALGWSGILLIGVIAATMPSAALALVVAGGVLYSAGVLFHHWRSLRFQNAIWHAFVLSGAVCHFLAIAVTLAAPVPVAG